MIGAGRMRGVIQEGVKRGMEKVCHRKRAAASSSC